VKNGRRVLYAPLLNDGLKNYNYKITMLERSG